MTEYLSARKFAELVGVSNVQISKLVKQGRLPTNEKGQIPRNEGLAAYESSKRLGYENNREHNAKVRAASKAKKPSKAEQNKSPPPVAPPSDVNGDGDDVPLAPSDTRISKRAADMYNVARAKKETENAKLAELKRRQIEGELVERSAVQAEAAQVWSEVREQLLAIPPRVAPVCEGKTAREIENLIDAEINMAIAAVNPQASEGKGLH